MHADGLRTRLVYGAPNQSIFNSSYAARQFTCFQPLCASSTGDFAILTDSAFYVTRRDLSSDPNVTTYYGEYVYDR